MCDSFCNKCDSYYDEGFGITPDPIEEKVRQIIYDGKNFKNDSPSHYYNDIHHVLGKFTFEWGLNTHASRGLLVKIVESEKQFDGVFTFQLFLIDYTQKLAKAEKESYPIITIIFDESDKTKIFMQSITKIKNTGTLALTFNMPGTKYEYFLSNGNLRDWVEDTTLTILRENMNKYLYKLIGKEKKNGRI